VSQTSAASPETRGQLHACDHTELAAQFSGLSGDGFLMWLLITVFYAPVMTFELLLLSIHFDMWKRYQKIVAQSGWTTWK
jgi:hypothetical protein